MMIKKTEIYPATINDPEKVPFFNTISDPIFKHISKKSPFQPSLFSFNLSNAYVSPFGVVFKNGKIIRESLSIYSKEVFWNTLFSFYKKILKNKVRKIEGDCIVISHSWYDNYYHWLIEIMPRLFLLKNELFNKKLIIHKNISKFHFEMLSKFNFKEIVFIEDNELLKCENISFTSFPNYSTTEILNVQSRNFNIIDLNINYVLMKEMKQWFQNNPSLIKTTGNKKIYISRKKAPKRQILNEKELETFLVNNGFIKVFLEDYSFDKQVELMNNSSIVIGCHGAGLANILFMEPKTHVINLINNNFQEFCYLTLAGVAGVNYSHVNCTSNSLELNPAFNDITVDLDIIREILGSIHPE